LNPSEKAVWAGEVGRRGEKELEISYFQLLSTGKDY
jgi:hypothetical protein